jgi:hypothetical protein
MATELLLVCKSDTAAGETVGAMSELGPDVWDLERETLKKMSRDGLAWYAEQAGTRVVGPVRWAVFDITRSVYPYAGAPLLEQGVWE